MPTLPSHTPKLVLYSYWRSSSAYRVRLALAVKGIVYEQIAVNLLTDEQNSAQHKALNPMGYVPCLLVEGAPFVESVAIIELLDELFPAPPLYPRHPYARAQVRALVEIINAGTQPLQNRHVLLHYSKDADAQRAWAKHFVEKGLAAYEGLIARHAKDGTKGKFSFGDGLTAADLYLVPQMYNARRFGIDVAQYPRSLAAEQAVLEMDAVKSAIPEAQPDAPKK
jgi:maleylacetoacetate isomerase